MFLPTLFLSHGGGPGFFMKASPLSPFAGFDSSSPACQAFKEVGANKSKYGLPEEPSAIVCISAHWEERDGFHVLATPSPKLMYDYYGFPQETYQLKYPAPGNPELAKKVVEMINLQPGCKGIIDTTRSGFDHGVFMPLLLLYPKANIPIVQVSLHSSSDVELHYKLGKALAPLREQNVLIIGSGQATHPMSDHNAGKYTGQFIQSLEEIILRRGEKPKEEELTKGLSNLLKSSLGSRCHNPGVEHFIPLVVALGATSGSPARDMFKRGPGKDFRAMDDSFSMASYVFGEESAEENCVE